MYYPHSIVFLVKHLTYIPRIQCGPLYDHIALGIWKYGVGLHGPMLNTLHASHRHFFQHRARDSPFPCCPSLFYSTFVHIYQSYVEAPHGILTCPLCCTGLTNHVWSIPLDLYRLAMSHHITLRIDSWWDCT